MRAGAGTVPLDFRLTRRGESLQSGGDTPVTTRVVATIPPAALLPGSRVVVTSIGAQALPAPLPLGWSPIAAAEIAIDDSATPLPLSGARLTFALASSDVTAIAAAAQTLTAVQYDSDRDAWRVVAAVVPVTSDGSVAIDILTSGDYALVYADRAPLLAHPAAPHTGAALQGVADPCTASPDICRPASRSFVLDPSSVPPNGRTVATLTADGTKPYPSGTAVQATIDEQLNLADGRVIVDPPFTTDLLLYRTPAGDVAIAAFHLAPSAQAAGVTLRDGVDHIRIVDYPGRVDRGALIGAEGGRVAGGEMVSIDIPTGATADPIHASIAPMSDFSSFGTIAGFQIAGGFTLSLERAGDGSGSVALLQPARATLTVDTNRQVVIAEVVSETPFGRLIRLAAVTQRSSSAVASNVFVTKAIDPFEGIAHGGSYLVLVADAPIAFAFGQVRLGSGGPSIAGALVTTSGLGLTDLTRVGGLFVIPVPAKPAAPFVLRARSIATGEGAPAASSASPDADAVIPFGDLILSVQAPHLLSLTPANGAMLDPNTAVVVQATFDMPIDPASVAGAFLVSNIAGTADAAGSIVTFHPSEPLRPATQYAIEILPMLRGSNGAPFGHSVFSQFSTRSLPAGNTSIRPELVHITIPDANGRSTISGRAGAIPAGAQAVAVRRLRNFVTQYQATAASDGSFAFPAGGGVDAIAITDAIDLQLIDAVSHAIVGIIPLTPFTTPDGSGFLAPPDAPAHFVSPAGVTVDVPAGAFEAPTVITLAPAPSDALAFASEVSSTAGVKVQFDGVSKKRIDIELPVATNIDTSKPAYLGYLGQSIRGPRVMIVDTLRIEGGRFTTRLPSGLSSASLRPAATGGIRAASVLADNSAVKSALLGVVAGGTYAAVSLNPATSWALFDGLSMGSDLFWDSMPSMYASSLYVAEGHGRVLVPVAANRRFEVVGVDASTGLESFRRIYDPQPAGDPLGAIALPSPIDNQVGPYPVFVSPARVEVIDIPAADVALTSARNFELTLSGGLLRVTAASNDGAEVLDLTNGNLQSLSGGAVTMPASVGDRIVLLVSEQNVDPADPVSIVFNKPVFVSGDADAYLHANQLLKVLSRDPRGSGAFADITQQVRFESDSGDRRITIHFENPLQLGRQYRLVISRNIGDTVAIGGTPDLHLGQRRSNGAVGPLLGDDLHVDFSIREPAGRIASFDLRQGTVRDLALNGNIALVSARDGGLQAFDVSDPAALDAGNNPRPIATVPAGATEFWAVASDHHARVYTTGLTSSFGVLRTYRLSDLPRQVGSATVSWRPGINSNVPLGSETIVGDRPEATPRKLQIVLQDDELEFTPATLISAFSGSSVDLGGGFQKVTITVRGDRTIAYQTQRVTVENRSLDLRWSVDVAHGGSATIAGIIARADDRLVVLRNRATYGVISLFGYGISVFDLNAVESNDVTPAEANYRSIQEQVALSNGAGAAAQPCDPAQSAASGAACPIRDLAFSPEALIASTSTSTLKVFALDASHGVLDLNIAPPSLVTPAGGGLTLGSPMIDQPRMRTLRELYRNASGRSPFAHFTSIAAYKNYALIAGNQFGLDVVRLDGGALDWGALVDVVWIPAGAYSVRVMPDGDSAVVVDGAGRVLIVDLKKIDESSQVPALPQCTNAGCSAELFPTARKALTSAATPLPRDADWAEVGADDPRIVWKSAAHLVRGTLPPLIDPSTGFLFTGDVSTTRMNVVAAADPPMRVVANNGQQLGGITALVPMGIDPPPNIVSGVDGSLAAFRVEATFPSGVAPRLAVENELVRGFSTATRASLALGPVIPSTVLAQFPALRLQRGANRFVSPWVIALADPRASSRYVWPAGADKAAEGCHACDRPRFLQGDSSAIELLASGRFVAIHPDRGAFTGPYDYLNAAGRLTVRLANIPADTVRPAHVLSPAHDLPFAGGALQAGVLLHSGEIVEQAIDLDAGGRAGWDVVLDRTYRSRTLGGSPIGLGWESSMFRRLRPMPGGDVEYRDATGEVWLFRQSGPDYVSPAGLYLRLTRTDAGWNLVDQKQRITTFDVLGRLATESDVFYDGRGGGNIIRYIYDSSGRLTSIVDPVGRVSTLTYDAVGMVKSITDWRGRTVSYAFDAQGRLTSVDRPRTKNPGYPQFDRAPAQVVYRYQDAAAAYNAQLELATNLRSIQEPGDAQPRVTFDFYDSGSRRDMLQRETWGTSDNAAASFDYTLDSPLRGATSAVVVDALGQRRTYDIGRAHIDRIVESGVPVWSAAAFAALPPAVLSTSSDTTNVDRTITFTHNADGLIESINHAGVSLTTFVWASAQTIGSVLQSRTITAAAPAIAGLTQNFEHAGPFLAAIDSDGERVDAPEPRRDTLTTRESDGGAAVQSNYNADGLLREWHTLPPVAPAAGTGEKAATDYFAADDPSPHRRALPRTQTAGDDLSTATSYPDADTEVHTAPRGVQTRVDYDELRRPIHIVMSGGGLAPEEWFAYDARGRLVRHRRKQGDREPEERYEYDLLGRVTRSSLHDGGTEIEATQYQYNLTSHINTTILPAGGTITAVLDSLGRTVQRRTDPRHPFATMMVEETRYDLDDNIVFTSDGRSATATRYDAAHRAIESMGSDLTRTATKFDGWGRLRETKDLGTGALFRADYTPAGKLRSTATNTSSEEYGWDAAGRTKSIVRRRGSGQPISVSSFDFDSAGRLLDRKSGASDGAAITDVFSRARYAYNGVDVPGSITTSENRDANSFDWSLDHDTVGNTTRAAMPSFVYQHAFDEAGNVTSSKTPRQPGTFEYRHDARGLTTDELLPGTANPNHYEFDGSGALTKYLDPESEATRVTNDGLGRPVLRTYADGTTEETHYDGDRVVQVRDRQGRILDFAYNGKGQLEQIHDGSRVLDELSYDGAGRLIGWKSEGTKIEYDDFDADSRPQTTRQARYRSDGTELDRYTQRHTWNGDGARTSWTIPGSDSTILQEYDAMGNITAIRRGGSTVMSADYRNSGRPKTRTVGPVTRQYEYDDIGRLTGMQAVSGGQIVAGSRVSFNGLLRTSAQHLGVSGDERFSNWSYDDRGRLTAMAAAADQDAAPSVMHELTAADFQSRFTPKPGGGHKIGAMLYQKADGSDGGSQRTQDDRFRYEFDQRGRLRKVTDLAGAMRVVYSYNAMDRMVGRRLESGPEWRLAEGPASSITFVWDLVSDQLIAMFEAEKYEGGVVVPSGRLLRQFIHGGLGYDDPIEVFDGVRRYYPVFDEAGAGSLQAVIDESGKVVSRSIIADPYGEDAETLNGPAVDKITVTGSATGVKVNVHVTEPVETSTVPAAATLSDPYTITWTMPALTSDFKIAIPGVRSTTFGPSVPVLFSGYTVTAASVAQAGHDFTLTPYNVQSLSLLGTRDTNEALVISPFKAHPYTDPFTGLDYVRARWLDRRTGTFLSPDPAGYRDSANLYAYCAGDPVNCSDPTGELTIILHGTFAAGETWWRRSGTFAKEIDAQTHDVWRVTTPPGGPKDVSEVPALAQFGPSGMFSWSGGNSAADRLAGAKKLAQYINTVRRFYPNEPINVVTHSHGGNVATASTNRTLVSNAAQIDDLVVIAKPYFAWTGLNYRQYRYSPDPQNVQHPILSIYSSEDAVQLRWATEGNGENAELIRNGLREELFVHGERREQNPAVAGRYINVEVRTSVGGIRAHGVQHSGAMGRAIGKYLTGSGRSSADWGNAMQGVPQPITGRDVGD